MIRVYLGGPIYGCDGGEANDWRTDVTNKLRPHGLIGVSPLRCEPPPAADGQYAATYGMPDEEWDPFYGRRSIASKNLVDVKACDVTLAYIPRPPEGRHHSWGTMGELCWAGALGKPTVLVTDDSEVRDHPVLDCNVRWYCPDLDTAVDLLLGVFGVYATPAPFKQSPPCVDEMRELLFKTAPSFQGGHSSEGAAIAAHLGVPFPITMESLDRRARAEGFNPATLWPWRESMRRQAAAILPR